MDNILFPDQYRTRPAANPASIKVKTNGKKVKILACIGSVGAGLSFCCSHIVKPIMIGSIPMFAIDKNAGTSQGIIPNNVRIPKGSGADKSCIHP